MFKLLTHWVFPGSCCLCDSRGHKGLDLCEVCLGCLVQNKSCCFRCAIPIESQSSGGMNLCGVCLNKKPLASRTIAPYIFDYPTDYIVRSLKFNQQEKYARLMGELLALHVQDSVDIMPDCLIPVPLHRQRYLERGFNQADLITVFCSKRLSLPVLRNWLVRKQNTVPQSGLGRRLRKKNLRGAFQVQYNTQVPRHVAVIDDVITTGSTVNEIAQVLLQTGVERVDVWAFSRTAK